MSSAPIADAASATPRSKRVPFWDNARFVCIVLVVLGHAIQRLTYDSDIAMSVYIALYAFHMPAFAIISGYFSKSEPPTKKQMSRVITDILLPYVIFELLWMLTKWIAEGDADPNLTKPSWTLWFLLALGMFRLVLPYLALLRWPLLWGLIISLGVGYLPNVGTTFSLSRALGFLPFFLLGWWVREHKLVDRFRLLERPIWGIRIASIIVLAAAFFVAWRWNDFWDEMDISTWFFYVDAYTDLGADQWWAGGVRLLLIVLGAILATAFFTLIPRRATWWTTLGTYTMYVYLLHSFVLYPFRESGILRDLEPTWIWLPLVMVLSVAIAILLATKPVRWVFRPLIEPRPNWLFARSWHPKTTYRSDPTGAIRLPKEPSAK